MLYATKRELHAGLALNILEVRMQELSYYTSNINNIGLQASLLAGFAFSTLSSHSSSSVLTWVTDDPSTPFMIIDFLNFNLAQQFKVFIELFYLTSTISAMGSTLYTLYICLITSILGPGLALRGPEGSVDRAVVGLARVNRKVIQSFGFALNLFQFSILMTAFLQYHLVASLVCAVFVLYYMFRINHYRNKLTAEFSINPSLIVTGRFEDEGEGRDLTRAEKQLFPPLAEVVTASVGLKRKEAQQEVYRAETHQPSNVASNMMYHWQGPLPEEIDGELAAEVVPEQEGPMTRWFNTLFGADVAKPSAIPPSLRDQSDDNSSAPSVAGDDDPRALQSQQSNPLPAGAQQPQLRTALSADDQPSRASDAQVQVRAAGRSRSSLTHFAAERIDI